MTDRELYQPPPLPADDLAPPEPTVVTPTRQVARHSKRSARSGLQNWLANGGWMIPLALAVVSIPPLLMIIRLAAHSGVYSNWGDGAANELSVQNAVGLHQTVGPYDRFGWFHPGPMLFYLQAIPYTLMDWNGAALPLGSGLINLVAGLWIVALVGRRAGGKAALGTAALVCVFEAAFGATDIVNVWGPTLIILPAALFLVLSADAAAGGLWSLVGVVAVGTYLLQTDIGTGSAVLVGLLFAVSARLVVWWRARSFHQSLRTAVRPGVVAVVVGLVLWAPPFWQQITGNPGNLARVAKFFRTHNGHHSTHQAFAALSSGMLDPHIGLSADAGSTHHHGELALLLVGIAGLAAFCWWRRQWLACAMAALILPVAAAYFLSLRQADGTLFGYLVWWSFSFTLVAAIALVICVTSPGRPLIPGLTWNGRARLAGSIVIAGCAVAACWRLAGPAHRFNPGGGYGNVTQATLAVERLLPANAHRVLVCVASGQAWPSSAGVVADLRKDGFDARVNPYWLFVFGDELAPSGREGTAVVLQSVGTRPPQLSVGPVRTGTGGDLNIQVFQPPQGYVSAAQCPPVA